MSLPANFRDTDFSDAAPPMLGYVVALGAVFGLVALGLYWLEQPYRLPNPGLAAYKPPASTAALLTTSAETAMAMEHAARDAAGETTKVSQEAKPAEQKTARVARTRAYAYRAPRVAARPPGYPQYPQNPWGYAQNRGFGGYAQNRGFGGWF
jgi:hypothetical protein